MTTVQSYLSLAMLGAVIFEPWSGLDVCDLLFPISFYFICVFDNSTIQIFDRIHQRQRNAASVLLVVLVKFILQTSNSE